MPTLAPDADLDTDDVKQAIRAHFSAPGYRPPMLPAVALELLQLSQRPSARFEEVVQLLQKDPVLAARTLASAQSAFYAPRSPILSLHQAVVRLGLVTLRELVLEAALHLKVFRAPGFEAPMERLGRHSTAVAHVVRAVCARTRLDAEYAFLCGLLHDVGYAAALLALADDDRWRAAGFEKLAPVLDEVHDEASGLLARLWDLPVQIQVVVANHHDLTVDGRPQPLCAALVLAEQLCWEAGCGLEPPPPDANPLATTMPEAPIEGLDVNWSGLVEQAARMLPIDALGICAARAEAFDLLERLGLRGGARPPTRPAPAPGRTASGTVRRV
jgi:putative nucleotidyltransferase with HDIG domain